jgi:hypothetical protein
MMLVQVGVMVDAVVGTHDWYILGTWLMHLFMVQVGAWLMHLFMVQVDYRLVHG